MSIVASRVYFAADVHWQPASGIALAHTAFARFLNELVEHAKSVGRIDLYILGDLFDYWFERRGASFDFYQPHLDTLARAHHGGVLITVLYGNRDFTYRQALQRHTGACVAGDQTVVVLPNRRIWAEHGDLLCTRDWRYQIYRRIIRSCITRALSRLLTLKHVTRVIERMRHASHNEIQRKTAKTLDVVDSAVANRLNRGFDTVICGHIHRCGRRLIATKDRQAELITLGSWSNDTGSYAYYDGKDIVLARYPT